MSWEEQDEAKGPFCPAGRAPGISGCGSCCRSSPGPAPLAVPAFPRAALGQGLLYSKEKLCWQLLALPAPGQFLKGQLEGSVGAEQAAPWGDFG